MRPRIVRRTKAAVVLALAGSALGCAAGGEPGFASDAPGIPLTPTTARDPKLDDSGSLVIYAREGDVNDDEIGPLGPALVMMGGARPVDDAIRWMHATVIGNRRAGGDLVIVRATGDDTLSAYAAQIAPFNSVQTVRVPPAASFADLERAARIVALAEIVLFAEDDGAPLLGWRYTPLVAAAQWVFDRGGIVAGVGGSGAIFGEFALKSPGAGAAGPSSLEALADPYAPSLAYTVTPFAFPQLEGLLVEPHFRGRDRFGRLAASMARQVADGVLATDPPRVYGLGIDDGNAVMVDRFGRVTMVQDVTATGGAYVLTGGAPRQIAPAAPLIYDDLVVARLDAAGELYDLDRRCGTAFQYRVSVTGGRADAFTPADPYEAQGVSVRCPR